MNVLVALSSVVRNTKTLKESNLIRLNSLEELSEAELTTREVAAIALIEHSLDTYEIHGHTANDTIYMASQGEIIHNSGSA